MRWVTAPLEEGGQTRATWGSASQAQDQEGALEVNHIQLDWKKIREKKQILKILQNHKFFFFRSWTFDVRSTKGSTHKNAKFEFELICCQFLDLIIH